ncbi:MAG: RNA-directed DNA polymerase [Planctomycetes bacterium]|nr:RNA-directed DNA polymerase [Planctomycetota bacterium]
MEPDSPSSDGLRIQRIEHLASQLGFPVDRLVDCAEHAGDFYHDFKRNVKGKDRDLTMARPPLSVLQRRILDRILCRLPVSEHAFGAIKGRSIRDNAVAHARAPFVAKLDIRDFYPSIRYQKIYDFFMAQGCSPDVARTLTLLTTRNYSLPLGTSTSPFLADQVVHPIDTRIGGLAKAKGLRYTRYVDDVTLSGPFDLEQLAKQIVTIIRQAGFAIKRTKMEFYRPDDGKERIITGVRVQDGKVSAPSNYIELLKRDLVLARKASLHEVVHQDFDTRDQFRGKIGYVMWLDPKAGRKLIRLYRKVKWSHFEYATSRRKSMAKV